MSNSFNKANNSFVSGLKLYLEWGNLCLLKVKFERKNEKENLAESNTRTVRSSHHRFYPSIFSNLPKMFVQLNLHHLMSPHTVCLSF